VSGLPPGIGCGPACKATKTGTIKIAKGKEQNYVCLFTRRRLKTLTSIITFDLSEHFMSEEAAILAKTMAENPTATAMESTSINQN